MDKRKVFECLLNQFETDEMRNYCAVFDEYGKYPSRIVWNHFFDLQVTNIPFVKEDFDRTLQWASNLIDRIYSDENFEAVNSYMMCSVLCGYRNSCCYAKEESENN